MDPARLDQSSETKIIAISVAVPMAAHGLLGSLQVARQKKLPQNAAKAEALFKRVVGNTAEKVWGQKIATGIVGP